MTPEQYRKLNTYDPSILTLRAHEILGADRTLLFGYTADRDSWHVYLKDRQIHRVRYTHRNVVLGHDAQEVWDVVRLVPEKRVYPESTDAAFAQMLKRRGVDVPYLPFDEGRYQKVQHMTFHGMIAE